MALQQCGHGSNSWNLLWGHASHHDECNYAQSEVKDDIVAKFTFNRPQGEQGITILLVAVAIVGILAMAALAIDIASLYVAHGEAQRAADAGALAGAQVLVAAGVTA